jgi:hypothetical protein
MAILPQGRVPITVAAQTTIVREDGMERTPSTDLHAWGRMTEEGYWEFYFYGRWWNAESEAVIEGHGVDMERV